MVNLLKNKVLVIFLGLSLALLLAGLILVLANVNNLSPPLIIHINANAGVDMMGGINHLWFLISMGAFILIVNSAVAGIFFFRERIVSYITMGVSFITSLFILVSVANIITLN